MPPESRFADVRKKLESHGWQLSRIKGSHHVFTGENRPLVTISVHRGKVKHAYVKLIEKAIKEIERQGSND